VAARGRQSSPRQPSVFLSPPLDHFLPLLAYSRFPSEVLAMIMMGFISITEAHRVSVCYNRRHTRLTRGIFYMSPATVKDIARHTKFSYRTEMYLTHRIAN